MHLATPRRQLSGSTAKGLLYANFNSDGSFFAIGTSTGFQLFRSSPFKRLLRQESGLLEPPLTLAEMMMEGCQIGGGPAKGVPPISSSATSQPSAAECTIDSGTLTSHTLGSIYEPNQKEPILLDTSGFSSHSSDDLADIRDVPLGPDISLLRGNSTASSATVSGRYTTSSAPSVPLGPAYSSGLGKSGDNHQSDSLPIPIELKLGGIAIVELHNSSNLMALVGGGKFSKSPPNILILWDDRAQCIVAEIELSVEIKDVRLRKDRIIILLATKVLIYSLSSAPRKLYEFDCSWNNIPIIGSSSAPEAPLVLAFPARSKGQIQTAELPTELTPFKSGDALERTPNVTPSTGIIAAHASKIACLAVSRQGTLVASASERGTLIRVFDCRSSALLNELRRGADYAEIYSIVFNTLSTRICVASDKGTLHIFNLSREKEPSTIQSACVNNGSDAAKLDSGSNQSHAHRKTGSAVLDQMQRPSSRWSSSPPCDDSSVQEDAPSSKAVLEASHRSDLSGFSATSHLRQISHAHQIPYSSSTAPSLSPSALKPEPGVPAVSSGSNRHSILAPLSSYLPKYFSSDWSFAHCTLPVECRCVVSFTHVSILANSFSASSDQQQMDPTGCGPHRPSRSSSQQQLLTIDKENAIVVLCSNGGYFLFSFEPKKGGECAREAFIKFFKDM
ncbi:hypothetical protein BASA62_003109 [Batrachochytrium salamandrivorans]|nr:hypothetical protein BASA62_003109 [Batrachochytrium salamandrivorans]